MKSLERAAQSYFFTHTLAGDKLDSRDMSPLITATMERDVAGVLMVGYDGDSGQIMMTTLVDDAVFECVESVDQRPPSLPQLERCVHGFGSVVHVPEPFVEHPIRLQQLDDVSQAHRRSPSVVASLYPST